MNIIPIFIPISHKHKLNLHPVRYIYFKYSNREYIREIVSPPESIIPIVEYALTLKEKYGKDVKLTLIKTGKNREYLRFKREDGIPIYISMHDRTIYVLKKDIHNPITPIAIGYFTRSCGYKLKDHYKREVIAKLLPLCDLVYIKIVKTDTRYKCPVCGYVSNTLHALKMHFKKVHLKEGTCPICGKSYRCIERHVYQHAKRDREHLRIYYLVSSCKLKNELRDKSIEILEREHTVKVSYTSISTTLPQT